MVASALMNVQFRVREERIIQSGLMNGSKSYGEAIVLIVAPFLHEEKAFKLLISVDLDAILNGREPHDTLRKLRAA